jgi:hypothetical protein
VHHYWAWFASFHFMLRWFCITGNGLYWFTSYFTCSSLLGIKIIQTPRRRNEPVKHEVKQCNPCTLRKNQWSV